MLKDILKPIKSTSEQISWTWPWQYGLGLDTTGLVSIAENRPESCVSNFRWLN